MQKENKLLFKSLVGSNAHGLATDESDIDYRGVFVTPTSELLKLGERTKTTSWIEGKEDDTSWEIGHFLLLAIKCNPTILETFLAPIIDVNAEFNEEVRELRALFPYVWNSTDVMNAFIGYGHNQRKKMLENKDGNKLKYAVAYMRTLYQAKELLKTGTFTIKIADTDIGQYLKAVKFQNQPDVDISMGAIINTCNELEQDVRNAYVNNPDKQTDIDKINTYLLKIRSKCW